MSKVFYKVSESEQENNKWILNRIFYNAQCGRTSYILSSSIVRYADLFEQYYEIYHNVCPASIFSGKTILKEGDILCVNDLLGNFHCNILEVIKDNIDKCDYLYVTVLGKEVDTFGVDVDNNQHTTTQDPESTVCNEEEDAVNQTVNKIIEKIDVETFNIDPNSKLLIKVKVSTCLPIHVVADYLTHFSQVLKDHLNIDGDRYMLVPEYEGGVLDVNVSTAGTDK